jgi:hypothetical protein
MVSEAAGYLNSKWFILSFFGGYLFFIIAMISGKFQWTIGTGVGFVISIIAYFIEYLNGVNELSGSTTIDSILYRLGLKPCPLKLHVAEIEPIDLDLEKLKASNDLEYEERKIAQITIITDKVNEIKAGWKSVGDVLKDIRSAKETNIVQVLQNEMEDSNPVKDLYAYRCVLLKGFKFPGEDHSINISQVVIITKRPWGIEIWPHQDDVIYKNMQLNTQLCYSMLIRWGMSTNDIPILYTKFTDMDAFKESKVAIDAKKIVNIDNRVMDGLLSSQRSKYMAIDKSMTDKEYKIDELKDKNEDMSQYLKMAMARPFQTKSDQIKNNQMKISKGTIGFMIVLIILLIGLVAFFLASTINLTPIDTTILDSTTTTSTGSTTTTMLKLIFK